MKIEIIAFDTSRQVALDGHSLGRNGTFQRPGGLNQNGLGSDIADDFAFYFDAALVRLDVTLDNQVFLYDRARHCECLSDWFEGYP